MFWFEIICKSIAALTVIYASTQVYWLADAILFVLAVFIVQNICEVIRGYWHENRPANIAKRLDKKRRKYERKYGRNTW